ncbi:hypothetical protein D9V28_09670 [Mycetocola zhadangensis]|uniref:Uncharacterized protein n=1 Tax=Mycetocola zhadangensis TaxID=1164595 RepID=A0A3L7J1M6_9MICO|nr:hypothetical protein D9V28_09670 [Mycetocola zhadangensis]
MACVAIAATFVSALTGCSVVDTVIWGPDGSRVIDTTERVIRAAATGDEDTLTCGDAEPKFGKSQDWTGLSAGEPERFHAEYWEDQEPLDPAWNINLEVGPEGVAIGEVFPSDVFYRETGDGLCVVDIVWATVVG